MLGRSYQTSPERIRVLIVDDQPVMRCGLKLFLLAFDDLEFVGEAADGEEALRLCVRLKPDVVLMDLRIPVMNSVYATKFICQYCPHVKVVSLIDTNENNLSQKMLAAGAVCCLSKSISADELANIIRRVFAGQILNATGHYQS